MAPTPTPSFKVTTFFDAKYFRNGTTYRYSVIEILIGTYTRPTRNSVISNDLAGAYLDMAEPAPPPKLSKH